MKAIVINPRSRSVEVQDLEPPTLQALYRTIGCTLVQCVQLGPGLDLWVDEEGLFAADQRFWLCHGIPTPLAGVGVIMASDPNGNTLGLEGRWKHDQMALDFLQEGVVRFVGDEHDLEVAIQEGRTQRPENVLEAGDHREVLWRWEPNPKE